MRNTSKKTRDCHATSKARVWLHILVVLFVGVLVFAGSFLANRMFKGGQGAIGLALKQKAGRFGATLAEGGAAFDSNIPMVPEEWEEELESLGREAVESCGAYALKVTGSGKILFLVSFVPTFLDRGAVLSDVVFEESSEPVPDSVQKCLTYHLDGESAAISAEPLSRQSQKANAARAPAAQSSRYAMALCVRRNE